MTHDTETGRWSLNGQIMAWVVAVEVALAIVAISHPEFRHPQVLVAAAAVAMASAVLAARARMPAQAKVIAIAAVCAALLALAAAQDPFGLRAVDRDIRDATQETRDSITSVEVSTQDMPVASSQTSLRSRGDAASAAFADDLARSVASKGGDAGGMFQVSGMIEVVSGTDGDTYRLTWSLARRAETLWCGRMVAVGQSRAAILDGFSTTIVSALRQPPEGDMACS